MSSDKDKLSELFRQQVDKEIKNNEFDLVLYARALHESKGDEKLAKDLYSVFKVEQLVQKFLTQNSEEIKKIKEKISEKKEIEFLKIAGLALLILCGFIVATYIYLTIIPRTSQ
jgi:hypothetical protein